MEFIKGQLKIEDCKLVSSIQSFDENIIQSGISSKLDQILEKHNTNNQNFKDIHSYLNKLIHANDSMDVCGALKDRHQNIGDGHIGVQPFAELLAHPAAAGVPLVLETPGLEEKHTIEVALLKELRDK